VILGRLEDQVTALTHDLRLFRVDVASLPRVLLGRRDERHQ
jgi:hypothetical protein